MILGMKTSTQRDRDLTEEQRIQRGQRAKSLIQSDSYEEAYNDIYQNLHTGLDGMKHNNEDNIKDIVSQIRCLRKLDSKLNQWVQESDRLQRLKD